MNLETFVPDPRLMDWPLWDSIPWDLQPFFLYDDLFGKPTVINEGRNEYERAMVRKAVRWNNAQFMEAFRHSWTKGKKGRRISLQAPGDSSQSMAERHWTPGGRAAVGGCGSRVRSRGAAFG
jgi:hypothetical protein